MDYEGFKEEILKLSGINLAYYKEKQMKRRIDSLINKHQFVLYEQFIHAIITNKSLYNEFINYLTINVSEFYRNPEQWYVLEKEILPILFERTNKIVVWSSACSTGDEPYTLVMVLNKFLSLSDIKIIASDIDKSAIEKAKAGIYHFKSVEKLPDEFREKYFINAGEMYTIKDDVKKCVEFRHVNLLADKYPDGCDLIVCRNVLIYFTIEAKNMIYCKFNEAMNKDGILFVGSTEQIILSAKYKFKPVKTFFYVKDGSLS